MQQLFGTAVAMAASVASLLALSILVEVHRHRRLARQLRQTARTTRLAEHEVWVVPGLHAPFVAGLARARIYCPADLAERLTADELRAVILHEHHHQLAHAPARLVLLAALRPALRSLPGGRDWLERRRGAIEIAADDHALTSGVRRSVLAQALVKLAAADPELSFAGYASASELRLRHLVGAEKPGVSAASRMISLLIVPLAGLVACLLR